MSVEINVNWNFVREDEELQIHYGVERGGSDSSYEETPRVNDRLSETRILPLL